MLKRLALSLLFLVPCVPLAAHEGHNCLKGALCKALGEGKGSLPGVPTNDLVCFVYPEVPAGSSIGLQLRTIGAEDKREPLEGFKTPRVLAEKLSSQYRTRFCVGVGVYEEADEAYLCAQFPDGTKWYSMRRREKFGGTGAFEHAVQTRVLNVCFGPSCPAHFTDK